MHVISNKNTNFSLKVIIWKSEYILRNINLHLRPLHPTPLPSHQVIAAEGEQKASLALKEAADIMVQSPAALQLRYLQTLNSISAEKNSTIIFPLPIDLLKGLMK